MNSMKCEGWIVCLYVQEQFIEHFPTPEDAERFAKKYYKDKRYFIKPLCYFQFEEVE